MNQRYLILGLFFMGCTNFDIDRTRYGEYPYSQRMQWTPPDPCNYETFEKKPCEGWRSEGKTNLAELLDYALCHNPSTEYSWAEAKSAYYGFQASKGILYPQITATFAESFEINTAPKNTNAVTNTSVATGGSSFFLNNSKVSIFEQDLTLTWLLFDFGGRCATIEVAKAALITANWTHNQAVQTVLYNVISFYYQAVAAIENVKALSENLRDAEESLTAAEVQFQAGLVTKVDVLQAKSTFAQAEYNLVQGISNQEIAIANLAQAAGMPPETKLDIVLVENVEKTKICQDVEKLIAIAKGSRNDLAALFANYQQSMAYERLAFSSLWPQVVATGDLTKTQISAGFGSLTNATATIGIQWNLFNGFTDEYNYYQSRTNVKAAYANWKEQEQQVGLQVVTAYNQFIAANENLNNSEEFYKYSYEAFEAALLGYKSGINTIINVLQTQGQLATARSQLIQSHANWHIDLANISYATGMLFEGGYKPCSDCYR